MTGCAVVRTLEVSERKQGRGFSADSFKTRVKSRLKKCGCHISARVSLPSHVDGDDRHRCRYRRSCRRHA